MKNTKAAARLDNIYFGWIWVYRGHLLNYLVELIMIIFIHTSVGAKFKNSLIWIPVYKETHGRVRVTQPCYFRRNGFFNPQKPSFLGNLVS